MPIVFEKVFRDEPLSSQLRPREDGAVPFACNDCGLGDTLMALGFVEGYRSMGIDSWISTQIPAYHSLLRAFGEVARDDADGAVRMGGRSAFYSQFLKKGTNTHTMIEWIREALPHNPPWVKPMPRISEEMMEWARTWLEPSDLEKRNSFLCQQSGPPVLIFPEAAYNTRNSPKNYWVDLANELRNRGLRSVAVLQSGSQIAKAFPVYLTGLSLENVAALCSVAQLVLGQDSGPSHLGGCLGVPTIAVCGPTRNMFDQYPSVRELHVDPTVVSCTGCWFSLDRGYRAACDLGCRSLQALTPEEILNVIDSLPQPPGVLRPRVGDQSPKKKGQTCGIPRSVEPPVRSPTYAVLSVRRMGLV